MISAPSLRHNYNCNKYAAPALHVAVLALLAFVLLCGTTTFVMVVDAGAILGKSRPEKEHLKARSISFDNQSGRKIDLFWVNVFKTPNEFVPQFVEDGKTIGCAYGADKSVSSYVGHVFEVREDKSKATGECVFDTCRTVRIKVSDRQDQKVTIERDFSVTVNDDKERAYAKVDDMFTRCQEQIAEYATGDENSSNSSNNIVIDPLKMIELITNCMEEEINGKVNFDREERSFHSKVHREMATDLIPFTCGDVNKTDSGEIINTTWSFASVEEDDEEDDEEEEEEGKEDYTYTIKTLHKLPTSEIFVVNDFVTQETCDALKIYRENANANDGRVVVPSAATKEQTKQGNLLEELSVKMYELLLDRFHDTWGELEFLQDETLFEYIKDAVGVETPSHLCVGPEAVAEAFAAMDAGKPKQCQIPGGDPVVVPTKRVVVKEDYDDETETDTENNNTNNNNSENNNGNDEEDGNRIIIRRRRQQLAQMVLFCDEPEKQLGGLHFPFAAVHVTPKAGKLVVAVHRHANAADKSNNNNKMDGYVNEYHLCPNHEVYLHTVVSSDLDLDSTTTEKLTTDESESEGEL